MKIRAVAAFYKSQDTVHAAGLVLADDGTTSLHDRIDEAYMSLERGGTEFLRKTLDKDDFNEGEGGFYVFFMHPPVQSHLDLVFWAKLLDGKEARVREPVSVEQPVATDEATNPVLPLRPTKDYANKWDSQGRERSPI